MNRTPAYWNNQLNTVLHVLLYDSKGFLTQWSQFRHLYLDLLKQTVLHHQYLSAGSHILYILHKKSEKHRLYLLQSNSKFYTVICRNCFHWCLCIIACAWHQLITSKYQKNFRHSIIQHPNSGLEYFANVHALQKKYKRMCKYLIRYVSLCIAVNTIEKNGWTKSIYWL